MTVSISKHSQVDSAEPQPTNVVELLRELGVKQVSVEKQKPALRAWLATHPANVKLRVSMCQNGYGLLLKESSVAHN
jgi:hypothetical protein